MNENEKITEKCPICGGKILEGDKLFACEARCGFRVFKNVLGAEITVEDLNILAAGEKTEPKSMTSNKGNKFEAALKLKPNLTELEFVFNTSSASGKEVGICPKCGKKVMATDGKFGKYYRCEDCDFRIGGTIASKSITEAQVKQLLTSGETKIIKGFTSSKGNKFDAKLKLDGDYKVVFEFENNK